jgi:hypothetical protein
MPHEVDQFGFPVDPELKRLESRLGELAGGWRWTYRQDVVEEYHQTMARLYELGWDAVLDHESELPDAFMPAEYLRRRDG